MTTITKTKWYHKPIEEASQQLYKRFENCSCVYQLIEKDRIVERYSCSNRTDENWTNILVTLILHGNGYVTVFIEELKHLQGWTIK